MGGFTLTGPNYVIKHVKNDSGLECKCWGLRIDIAAEEEAAFLSTREISVKDFHAIFKNRHARAHVYLGPEANAALHSGCSYVLFLGGGKRGVGRAGSARGPHGFEARLCSARLRVDHH